MIFYYYNITCVHFYYIFLDIIMDILFVYFSFMQFFHSDIFFSFVERM